MWDFSWLERRWPGAGYDDWDVALDALVLRGYDAVRIDAYPHLVAANPNATWELIPCWSTQDWGSPARNVVEVQPALNQFIRKCADRKLRVGLSTWFRHDPDQTLMRIYSPEDLGRIWKVTLDSIAHDGLLPNILYVDLCNEWPLDVWAPFLPQGFKRTSPENADYMRRAIQVVRTAYPDLDYTFSQTSEFDHWKQQDVSMLDFMEPHIWMAQAAGYYDEVGYHYERFDPQGYVNLVNNAKRVYMEKRDHWDRKLVHAHRDVCRMVAGFWKAAHHHRMLESGRLQRLALARVGLAQTALRTRCPYGGRHGALGRHRHQQFLWTAVCRHVARCRLASPDDEHHPLRLREDRVGAAFRAIAYAVLARRFAPAFTHQEQ